jgi:hypothetical protein
LLTDAGIELTGRSGTANELLVRVAEFPPDAVVVDIRLLKRHRSSDPLDALTPREPEVLELMAAGASNAGIAESRVITRRAAEKYVSVCDLIGTAAGKSGKGEAFLQPGQLYGKDLVGKHRPTRLHRCTTCSGSGSTPWARPSASTAD